MGRFLGTCATRSLPLGTSGSRREGVNAPGCQAELALPCASRRAPGKSRRIRAEEREGHCSRAEEALFNGGCSLLPLARFAEGRGERAERKE